MCPDFRTFFDNSDGRFALLFSGQLGQTDRRAQTGRSRTDDDDIKFHGFALHVKGSAEENDRSFYFSAENKIHVNVVIRYRGVAT